MLRGGPAPAALCFRVANDGNFLPADVDGAAPPADGTPGLFLNFETGSSLRLYQLSPDFTAMSGTLTQGTPDIAVATFTQACNSGGRRPPAHTPPLESP